MSFYELEERNAKDGGYTLVPPFQQPRKSTKVVPELPEGYFFRVEPDSVSKDFVTLELRKRGRWWSHLVDYVPLIANVDELTEYMEYLKTVLAEKSKRSDMRQYVGDYPPRTTL